MKIGSFQLFPDRFGYSPLLWLLYLIFPATALIQESGMQMWIGFAGLLLFVITYRQLYMVQHQYDFWLAVQLAIMFSMSLYFGIPYLLMGFFPANFIAWLDERTRFNRWYLVFVATILLSVGVSWFRWESLHPNIIVMVLVMIFSPLGLSSIYKKDQALREANRTIQELVKKDERQRIARDLHDTLGHTLSMITLKSQLAEKLLAKDVQRVEQEVKDIQYISRSALKQVRELVSNLRVSTIAEVLLESEQIGQSAGIEMVMEGDSLSTLSLYQQNVLALSIKEAVTNVIKHSQATKCKIKLKLGTIEAKVMIIDNGIGIKEVDANGSGLKGIEERLHFNGGTLDIFSEPGSTTISLSLPIVIKEQEAMDHDPHRNC